MVLGAIFSGVLSGIPLLGCLNCLFCLLNIAGVAFALYLYLRTNPDDTITIGECCGFGAIAGAGGGLIFGLMSTLFQFWFGEAMASYLAQGLLADTGLSNNVHGVFAFASVATAFLNIFLGIIIFAAFGLLGTFLLMQFFFKPRIRKV
jgi:hypothetical protein